MKRELHQNSLANLTHRDGRPPIFGKRKKQHSVTVTEEGWNGVVEVIEAAGCSSVSEFLERLGRGEVNIA